MNESRTCHSIDDILAEARARNHIPDIAGHDTRVVIVCNEGYSSSLAAALLRDIGLQHATDLIGGYQAWLAHREQ